MSKMKLYITDWVKLATSQNMSNYSTTWHGPLMFLTNTYIHEINPRA